MPILLLGMLKGVLIKLATQAFIEYLIVWAAEIGAKSTKTPYDDELVAKVKSALGQ